MLQNTKSTDNTLDGLKPENANRERKVEALIKVRNGVVAYFSDPELQQSILDMKNAMKAVAEVNASDWVWPGGREAYGWMLIGMPSPAVLVKFQEYL